MSLFRDRVDAGRRLAARLKEMLGDPENVAVLGLTRGGAVVAAEVARELGAPLDVVVVRKLGAPGQPELAIGAVAENGAVLVDWAMAGYLQVPEDYVEAEISRQLRLVEERSELYRRGGQPVPVAGKTCVLVDDGLATGSTAEAAVMSVAERGPERVIFAVPVGSVAGIRRVEEKADEVVCLSPEENLRAVSLYYRRFEPVDDEEVVRLLEAGG